MQGCQPVLDINRSNIHQAHHPLDNPEDGDDTCVPCAVHVEPAPLWGSGTGCLAPTKHGVCLGDSFASSLTCTTCCGGYAPPQWLRLKRAHSLG
jgi:hypothetical protein